MDARQGFVLGKFTHAERKQNAELHHKQTESFWKGHLACAASHCDTKVTKVSPSGLAVKPCALLVILLPSGSVVKPCALLVILCPSGSVVKPCA